MALSLQDVDLAGVLNKQGLRCKKAGRHAEALDYYHRARRLLEGTARHDDLATVDHNLAGIHHALGKYAEGELLARRGLAIRLALPRPDTELTARDLVALAALVAAQGRWQEAEGLYAEGIALLLSLPGDQRLEIAVACHGLGVLEAGRRRHAEALAWLEHSALLKRGALGDHHPDLGPTLHNLAVVLHRCGRTDLAAAVGQEALCLLDRSLGPAHVIARRCRRSAPHALPSVRIP
jgi:tetratricopeptide (TPR) repeat protein